MSTRTTRKDQRQGDREDSRDWGEAGRLLPSLANGQALREWNRRGERGGLDEADSGETAAKLSPVCGMSERAFLNFLGDQEQNSSTFKNSATARAFSDSHAC